MNQQPRSQTVPQIAETPEQQLFLSFRMSILTMHHTHEVLSRLNLDEIRMMRPADFRELKYALRTSVSTLYAVFHLRGETPPTTAHAEGADRFSLERMKLFLERFNSEVVTELRSVGRPLAIQHVSLFCLLGLTFRAIEALRIVTWCEKAAERGAPLSGIIPIPSPPTPLQLTATPPPVPTPFARKDAHTPAPSDVLVTTGDLTALDNPGPIREELSFAGLLDEESAA